jgi:hypothetical protein
VGYPAAGGDHPGQNLVLVGTWGEEFLPGRC